MGVNCSKVQNPTVLGLYSGRKLGDAAVEGQPGVASAVVRRSVACSQMPLEEYITQVVGSLFFFHLNL
jgi:hypothetical protein